MDTEKNHGLVHTPNDVAKWGDSENMSCKTPETGHKLWVKANGGKTNQGPAANRTMMKHTLRKEASELCCEAIQGKNALFALFAYYTYIAFFALMALTSYLQPGPRTEKFSSGQGLIYALER